MQNFADRVLAAIANKGTPACVGLDPLIERLPRELLREAGVSLAEDGTVSPETDSAAMAGALGLFGREVIRIIAPLVPFIIIFIAFFETYHEHGVRVYDDLIQTASRAGLITIGDIKRADIGHSATQYALAQLGGGHNGKSAAPDAVTVNPYFGLDGVRPFIDIAREQGRGVFILVQTSNASAEQVQGLACSDGSTLCQNVARLVADWSAADGLIGERGYSCVGAVVSPRDLPSTELIRTVMPNSIFLVPGFGAQGRTTDEVARCFKSDGTGAIVTSSRGVIYAFNKSDYRATYGDDWRRCIEQGCRDLVESLHGVIAP